MNLSHEMMGWGWRRFTPVFLRPERAPVGGIFLRFSFFKDL